MVQRKSDGLPIGGIDLVQQARLLHHGPAQHTAGHRRHQCQRHQQAGQQRVGDGQRQIGEQLAGQALYEHDGREHAHGGQGRGRHRAQHLARAGHRRLNDGGALGPQAVDILNDHHGVIHQHTHRHGQTAQGDHVDGHAGEVHKYDGKDHADGDRYQRDDRWPPIPQEQVQNDHGEQRAPQQRRGDGLHDQVDIVALVHQRREGQSLVLALQLLEPCADVIGHLRRGVVGLLGKGDENAVVAVDLGVQLPGVVRDHHGGDVAQCHRLDAVHAQVQQHHILQLLAGGHVLAHGYHVFHAAVVLNVPGRHGEILCRQQLADGGDGQHPAHVRLVGDGLVRLVDLVHAGLDLGHGLIQLYLRLRQLGNAVDQGERQVIDLTGDLPLQLAAFQILHQLIQRRVQPFQRLFQLFQLLLPGHGDGRLTGIRIRVWPRDLAQGLLQIFVQLIYRRARLGRRAGGNGLLGLIQLCLPLFHLVLGLLQIQLRLVQFGTHRIRQLLRQGVQLGLVQDHMGLPGHGAADRNAGHTGHALQLGGQLSGDEIAERVHVHVLPGHGGHHHRQHGWIDLQHIGGGDGVVPAALQYGDLLLDVHTDGIHIGAVLKLQRDHGYAVLAGGGDGLDLIQRSHGLLHRPGDGLLNGLRAGAGIRSDDDDIGKVHVGQQIRCHFQIRHHAQHDNAQHRHKDRQRFFHAEAGHIRPSFFRLQRPRTQGKTVIMCKCTIPAADLQAERRRIHESVTNTGFFQENSSEFVVFFAPSLRVRTMKNADAPASAFFANKKEKREENSKISRCPVTAACTAGAARRPATPASAWR